MYSHTVLATDRPHSPTVPRPRRWNLSCLQTNTQNTMPHKKKYIYYSHVFSALSTAPPVPISTLSQLKAGLYCSVKRCTETQRALCIALRAHPIFLNYPSTQRGRTETAVGCDWSSHKIHFRNHFAPPLFTHLHIKEQ